MLGTDEIKIKLIDLLQSEVVFAYLFGSVTSGRLTPQSDIDLAVYLNPPLVPLDNKLAFIQKVSAAFEREVDVIFLNDANIIITMQILTNGELVINNDPAKHILFTASKLSEYADFKLSRRIIEKNMLQGQIYA